MQEPPLHPRRPTVTMRVPPSGCGPDRRARLDTIIRLCDVAMWDLDVAREPAPGAVWVVRRTTVLVGRRPEAAERLTVDTWASAAGRVWAERRIDLSGVDGSVAVSLATLWASIDPATSRPTRLADHPPVADPTRRVRISLSHADPPEGTSVRDWPIRRSDIDVLGHVNNSVIWSAWEDTEAGGAAASDDAGVRYEAEYRAQLFRGPAELRCAADGAQVWLGAVGEAPAASVRRC